MEEEFLDSTELYNDSKWVGRTPQEIMERNFNDIYKRDLWSYLKSIEWDTWCKHETPEEFKLRMEERERNLHPFKKFF